jgi:hypothetical protein
VVAEMEIGGRLDTKEAEKSQVEGESGKKWH